MGAGVSILQISPGEQNQQDRTKDSYRVENGDMALVAGKLGT
jgi:hypothetical protein